MRLTHKQLLGLNSESAQARDDQLALEGYLVYPGDYPENEVLIFKRVVYYNWPEKDTFEPISEFAKDMVKRVGFSWPMNEAQFTDCKDHITRITGYPIDRIYTEHAKEYDPGYRMTVHERNQSDSRESKLLDREWVAMWNGWNV